MKIQSFPWVPMSAVLLLTLTSVSASAGGVLEGRAIWSLESQGISDIAEDLDRAGSALAVADWNGDGFKDLAIGIPGDQSDAMVASAGRVLLLRGSAEGLSPEDHSFLDQTHTPEGIEQNDRFGTRLQAGDFNGDGHPDLAVGVPNEDLFMANLLVQNAGEVDIFWGSDTGLHNSDVTVLSQEDDWIDETLEANAFFGFSLAAMDVNGDGADELAIGAPFATRGNGDVVGSVSLIFGNSDNWTLNPNSERYLPTDIEDNPPAPPVFGWDLALGNFFGPGQPGLSIGVPGHALQRGRFDAYRVNQNPGPFFVLEDRVLWGGSDEDLFGFSVERVGDHTSNEDNVIVGIPGRDRPGNPTLSGVGEVRVLDLNPPALVKLLRPGSSAVLDEAEAEDFFGGVIHAADVDGDGVEDMIVGVPNEDVETGNGSQVDAGRVHIFYGPLTNSNLRQSLVDASTEGLGETSPNAEGLFGFSLAAGQFDGRSFSLAVGVAGEDLVMIDKGGAVAIFDSALFADDFETGDASAWNVVVGEQ